MSESKDYYKIGIYISKHILESDSPEFKSQICVTTLGNSHNLSEL